MVLIPSNLNPTPSNLKLSPSLLNLGQLKIGQILSANLQPLNNNQAQVTIGSQTFTATLKEPITVSGDVKLVVKQTAPELQLAIQSNKTATNNQQMLQQAIQGVLRQFLPQQNNLNQILHQLNTLPPLPNSINQALQQLLEQLNRPQKVQNGKQLQTVLANSGLFFESKLKQGDTQRLQQDIKAQMLQLQKQALQLNQQQPSAALSKLSDLLNQAISRITVQQAQLLENPNINAFEYLSDVKHAINQDTIEIHKLNYENQRLWEVYLNLELPQGELNSKLTLIEQDSAINCFLWCDNAELQQDIEKKLPQLKQLFIEAGLNLNQLSMSANKLEPKQSKTQVALIDIRV